VFICLLHTQSKESCLSHTVPHKIIAEDFVQSLVAYRRLHVLLTITWLSKDIMKPNSQSQ